MAGALFGEVLDSNVTFRVAGALPMSLFEAGALLRYRCHLSWQVHYLVNNQLFVAGTYLMKLRSSVTVRGR